MGVGNIAFISQVQKERPKEAALPQSSQIIRGRPTVVSDSLTCGLNRHMLKGNLLLNCAQIMIISTSKLLLLADQQVWLQRLRENLLSG